MWSVVSWRNPDGPEAAWIEIFFEWEIQGTAQQAEAITIIVVVVLSQSSLDLKTYGNGIELNAECRFIEQESWKSIFKSGCIGSEVSG